MNYSITPVLHNHEDKKGLHKVNIQVIYNRMKCYAPTSIKISIANWDNGKVVKSELKSDYNGTIKEVSYNIETRLLGAIRMKPILTKSEFDIIVKGTKHKDTGIISDFIYDTVEQYAGKFSEGRLKHFRTMADKVEEYSPNVRFGNISVDWLNKFEGWLRKQEGRNGSLDGNTVQSNMNMLKSLLNKARVAGLIKKEQFEEYKVPLYVQKIPVYLTESELLKMKGFIDTINKPRAKTAGYYFLLSSFTGYRISDSKRFNFDEMVMGDKIVLRADKNNQIVSIPLYPQLKEIIEFVKYHPFDIPEQEAREYIKEICSYVGIKKHVKFHSSRHSFAMFLISKGFSIDEVAILLGDSPEIARVYARISNTHLENKFRDRLG